MLNARTGGPGANLKDCGEVAHFILCDSGTPSEELLEHRWDAWATD